jgi:RNA recognition motif-containing protein
LVAEGAARGVARTEKEDVPIPKRVFVGNLSFRTTKDELATAFAPAGNVISVYVGTDRETGRSRGFAFVEFGEEEEAARAIELFNEKEIDGRKLRVNPAEDRPRGERRPGSGPPPSSARPWSPSPAAPAAESEGGDAFGAGRFGTPFRKPKGSRRGLRGRKRSLY